MNTKTIIFAVFMMLLGAMSSLMMFSYSSAFAELLLDVLILCTLVSLCPRKARPYVFHAVAFVLFAIAIVDNFCFVKFSLPLSATTFLLLHETNTQEVSEFFSKYLNLSIFISRVGILLVLLCLYIGAFVYEKKAEKLLSCFRKKSVVIVSLCAICIYILANIGGIFSNYKKLWQLETASTIEEYTDVVSSSDEVYLFLPVYRFASGLREYSLSQRQLDDLKNNIQSLNDAASAPVKRNLFLIIGESHNKYNSSLYGYDRNTTPNQSLYHKKGNLIRFDNVIAPWNLTSYCFKYMFSMKCVDDGKAWAEYPLFPMIFRAAGYKVQLFTNQFVKKSGESMFDVNSSSFIVDGDIAGHLFDYVNGDSYEYDENLVDLYGRHHDNAYSLTIFHLKGQHYNYSERYPGKWGKWSSSDYAARRNLSDEQRKTLAEYDNATLYNDYVIDKIIQLAKKRDAIVVYLSDHSEQVFNDLQAFNGRKLTDNIDRGSARYEYEVPFWVYFPDDMKNDSLYLATQKASEKPFMTDALPHVLLDIAGIKSRWYNGKMDILSSGYDATRRRLMRGKVDYDKLKGNAF